MTLSPDNFPQYFHELWGHDPYPWQSRLTKLVFEKGWPGCIDLPTASGKTACIDIAVFVLACQAGHLTHERTVGRRIFFAVNRRVIVDEAFDRARGLAQRLLDCRNGVLRRVAEALRSVGSGDDNPPLDVAELRGGIFRDRAWARSISQPIVVCTTADQLGSRLLFRGYGVSDSSAPIHAALCGCDSLVLLDEAHVTQAFCQTMQLITRYQAQHSTAPKMHFVQLTATPAGDVPSRFGLEGADRKHPLLKARLEAPKPAALVSLSRSKTLKEEFASQAFGALSDTRKAIGIIANRVRTAREVAQLIRDEVRKRQRADPSFWAEVHLVIGRMRPIDRDDLQAKLRALVGPERPEVLAHPTFVIATQCLEVGADYDFDALITECASIDALRQRFGRLNRGGRRGNRGEPLEVAAAIITSDEALKDEDPIYGKALANTWEWLRIAGRKEFDFGISQFSAIWDKVAEPERAGMLAPAPDAAVLLPSHLDALSQTGPRPIPCPDVSFFIHGPQRSNAEVSVCWRADLGRNESLWPEIVRLLPPTSPECMTVPLRDVQRWMRDELSSATDDADAPALDAGDDPAERENQLHRAVVIWRGKSEVEATTDERSLRPGDTVVMPVSSRSWLELGHIPAADSTAYAKANAAEGGATTAEPDVDRAVCGATLDLSVDIAERSTRQSKRRLAIRLHSAFPGRAAFRDLNAAELRPQLTSLLVAKPGTGEDLPSLLTVIDSSFARHDYPTPDGDDPEALQNELIEFKRLIDPATKLVLPATEDDDGEGNLNECANLVSLAAHTKHVVDRAAASVGTLNIPALGLVMTAAARLHDLGKVDVRFQALLGGLTPYEAMERPTPLAKSGQRDLTRAERDAAGARAQLPAGYRHEMLSTELVANGRLPVEPGVDLDLLLHLIASHHGHARPFAPVVVDLAADERLLSLTIEGNTIDSATRRSWIPAHGLDSGVAERFWKLTEEYGWWGLAWLESILRLADQQASAGEQRGLPYE